MENINENLEAMTINERLWTLGLMKDYEKAIKEKDKEKFIEILSKIKITRPEDIECYLKSHAIGYPVTFKIILGRSIDWLFNALLKLFK
jgi:hypothetical protein